MNPDLRAIEAALRNEPHNPSNLSPEAASVVLPLVRRVVQERDELRAALEEARLTLAAEQGRAEGASSDGWQAPTRVRISWRKEGPGWLIDVSKRYDLWDWDHWVLGVAAGAPTATGTAQTARAAMLAADKAIFESRRTRCIAKARQLQNDGVILYPPNGTHQQTPAIMNDRLSDPDLTEAVLAIYEKVLFA